MTDLAPIIENGNLRYAGSDLIHYFRLVMRAPNFHAPYHNFRHMAHVCWEAYDGGVHMGLDPRELRNLLIAALMHDYDHTGTKGDDSVNIERSIRALDKYALEEDRPYLLDIREYIRATRFPYDDRDQFNQNHLILRDADQSQTFSLVWMQSLAGLAKELDISYESMLRGQKAYMESLKFHTLWGKNKFVPLIPMHIARVDKILSLIQEETVHS